MAFIGSQNYAKFYINETEKMFFNQKKSTGHHKKSYDYENNNNKNMQKTKIH